MAGSSHFTWKTANYIFKYYDENIILWIINDPNNLMANIYYRYIAIDWLKYNYPELVQLSKSQFTIVLFYQLHCTQFSDRSHKNNNIETQVHFYGAQNLNFHYVFIVFILYIIFPLPTAGQWKTYIIYNIYLFILLLTNNNK